MATLVNSGSPALNAALHLHTWVGWVKFTCTITGCLDRNLPNRPVRHLFYRKIIWFWYFTVPLTCQSGIGPLTFVWFQRPAMGIEVIRTELSVCTRSSLKRDREEDSTVGTENLTVRSGSWFLMENRKVFRSCQFVFRFSCLHPKLIIWTFFSHWLNTLAVLPPFFSQSGSPNSKSKPIPIKNKKIK